MTFLFIIAKFVIHHLIFIYYLKFLGFFLNLSLIFLLLYFLLHLIFKELLNFPKVFLLVLYFLLIIKFYYFPNFSLFFFMIFKKFLIFSFTKTKITKILKIFNFAIMLVVSSQNCFKIQNNFPSKI